jgi:TorA maturation chaperone TorD
MDKDLSILEPVKYGLSLLIRFHDREADRDFVDGLRDMDAAGFFAAILPDEAGQAAAKGFGAALDALPAPVDDAVLDGLAAEYADVYLTHSYRLSPAASVWLTEEKLDRQEPMFEVREWYDHYGVSVPDWRLRPDDHIVHELQFVEHLLAQGTQSGARDAARFMDRHVMVWVPEFCRLMAERCEQPFMIAGATLGGLYLEALRDLLQDLTGEERWVPEVDDKPEKYSLSELADDIAYVPGVAESW